MKQPFQWFKASQEADMWVEQDVVTSVSPATTGTAAASPRLAGRVSSEVIV